MLVKLAALLIWLLQGAATEPSTWVWLWGNVIRPVGGVVASFILGGAGLKWYQAYFLDKDQQEHDQSLDDRKFAKQLRDELRSDLDELKGRLEASDEEKRLLLEEVGAMRSELADFKTWGRSLVFAVRHGEWLKRRVFRRFDDYRARKGDEPLPAQEKERYRNLQLEEVLEGPPDVEGWSIPDVDTILERGSQAQQAPDT